MSTLTSPVDLNVMESLVEQWKENQLPNVANNVEEDESEILKIILLGDSAVGKSKLMERYLHGTFQKSQVSSTYALNLFRKSITLADGKEVKVDFWDTAGQENFQTMHPSFYYQAHACILLFDITRKQTYLNLTKWYGELRQYCENVPVIVAATKIDVDMMVTRKAFKFPAEHNLPFFFVSSADGTNVEKVFEEAICAAVVHKKFTGGDFITECLEILDNSTLDRINTIL